jgi:putative transcriptional regulator
MDQKNFAELLASAGEALDHAKGKRELRTTVIPGPPKPMTATQVRKVRRKMKASQAVFAQYLNVSPKLVQAWEADRRVPNGPALLLLHIAENNPGYILAAREQAIRKNRHAE